MTRQEMHECAAEGCTERGTIGLGVVPTWFCMEHYEAEMVGYGERVRSALQAAQDAQRVK